MEKNVRYEIYMPHRPVNRPQVGVTDELLKETEILARSLEKGIGILPDYSRQEEHILILYTFDLETQTLR